MSDLPTGNITYLFTDIEGSTRLWAEHEGLMRESLARHDAIVTAAVEEHGGQIVRERGEGDSFFSVFRDAAAAVAAACAMQRALVRETWPSEIPIRIRAALHSGFADQRDGDYYGATVNCCARLRAIAHGGQTLVSGVTRALIGGGLPDGASLEDLGRHRLKDVPDPEQVFQLNHPDLPEQFEPLRSVRTTPHNLPAQLTTFVGRKQEQQELKRLLGTFRLVTVTGSGGLGKTRLALQVAGKLLNDFPDGAWLVELAPLSDPALVPQAVAAALGVREEAGRDLPASLTELLRPRALLLILDNCEHLVEACAALADRLLRECPGLRIMATSREPLQAPGETTWRVLPLSVPDPLPADAGAVDRLRQYEATRLFLERARAAVPGFTPDSAAVPAVIRICRQLDGIPLAIELAAPWVRTLTVEEIARRLDDCFRVLTRGPRTVMPRHQTLRAAIDWSYALLSDPERELLGRLSVFAGGWNLGAVECICSGGGIDEADVFDLLARLVDRSLVQVEPAPGEAVRYGLLETVRQYSREKLRRSGAEARLQERHREWFLTLAEQAVPELEGPGQARCLAELEAEHDNLRAALEWSLSPLVERREGRGEGEAGRVPLSPLHQSESALRLAGALWRFFYVRGHLSEGLTWLRRALAQPGGSDAARAKALSCAGILAWSGGAYEGARSYHEECLRLRERLDDTEGRAKTLNNLGLVARTQADLDAAREYYQASLGLFQELNHPEGVFTALTNLAVLANDRGDFAAAGELLETSLAISRERGNDWGAATSLHNLAEARARAGEPAAAEELLKQALILRRRLGDRRGMVFSLLEMAEIDTQVGRFVRAAMFYAAVTAVAEALDAPLTLSEVAREQEHLERLREEMGEAEFAHAWQRGCELGIEEAVACALGEPGVDAPLLSVKH